MILFEQGVGPLHLEAVGAREPVDGTGAGDTVIATYTIALASDASFPDAARLANYAGGSVAVFPVEADGHLGDSTDFIQHAGKSVTPDRQSGPHAHCVTMSPDNRIAFVCDLGLDKVMCYRFDAEHGKLTPADPAFVSLIPGAGPRHMVFRPDGKFAYVINELNSTVTAFAYDPQSGKLTEMQSVSTLPGYWEGKNSTA